MQMPPSNSFAIIPAQAPAVSAAFGRWLGFVLIMTALLGAVSLGFVAILLFIGVVVGNA